MSGLGSYLVTPVGVILAAMVLTFFTRTLGAAVLARFERLPPRVEAGLEAIPPAVLTAIVAPQVVAGGPAEWIAVGLAVALSFRLSLIWVVFLPTLTLALLRQWGGL